MKKVLRLNILLSILMPLPTPGTAPSADRVIRPHPSSPQGLGLGGKAAARSATRSFFHQAKEGQAKEGQKAMDIRFFHLVNQTGAEVKVQVLADGKELFVNRMEADVEPSRGIVHPAPVSYPTQELKVSMSREAKRLTVKETLHLKKRQSFTISALPEKADAGFQIVLNRDGIAVTQDYHPVR